MALDVGFDELVPEAFEDRRDLPHEYARPSLEILRIGRAEGTEVPPDEGFFGTVFRGTQSRVPQPLIDPGKGNLLAVARPEADESPNHGGPDEVPRVLAGPRRVGTPAS